MGRRGIGVTLKHVQRMIDRHGHERFYFRKAGTSRVTLPGKPGDAAFLAAYQSALASAHMPPAVKEPFGAPGSFHRLIADYYRSIEFKRTKPSSQAVTRGILNRFQDEHGPRLVAQMERRHVAAIIAARFATPGAANSLLRKLRALIGYAIQTGWISSDPTARIKTFKEGTHHTWTDAELAQFESHWPVGSRERTAYALALYTGQRRGDVVHMAWGDYDAKTGLIRVVQQKTGTELSVPVHRELRRALESWPQRHVTILATKEGRGTSVAGFGNFMAEAIEKAGLPARCVLHGLRKAAARRLAEAGCSSLQIMAITGHKSLTEVERYTEAAQQVPRATDAIHRLELSTRSRKGLQVAEISKQKQGLK